MPPIVSRIPTRTASRAASRGIVGLGDESAPIAANEGPDEGTLRAEQMISHDTPHGFRREGSAPRELAAFDAADEVALDLAIVRQMGLELKQRGSRPFGTGGRGRGSRYKRRIAEVMWSRASDRARSASRSRMAFKIIRCSIKESSRRVGLAKSCG